LMAVLMEAEARVAERLAASGKRKAATEIYESLITSERPDSVRRGAFSALIALDGDHGENRILQGIKSSDQILRPLAIAAVRSLPRTISSEIFAASMPNLTPPEQIWLIESLTTRTDTAARRIIVSCLQSKDTVVRISAARALADAGDPDCALPLTQALTKANDSEEVQVLERALGRLPGGEQTDLAVLGQLKNAQGEARARLISSLTERQNPEALRTVFAEADNPDLIVASAAYHALGHMAVDDGLSVLLNKFAFLTNKDLYPAASESARDAVVATDDPTKRWLAIKTALAHCQDVEIRCALLQLLPLCGNAEALDVLRGTAIDSNSRVRDAGVRALADWPDLSAWKDLHAILQRSELEVHCSLAFRALVRLASEGNQGADGELAQRYRDLLQAARADEELKLVLGALGGQARPFALDLALPLLEKSSVHAEAEATVRRIAEALKNSDPQAAAQALSKLGSQYSHH